MADNKVTNRTYFMNFFLSRDFWVATESATRGLFILSFKYKRSIRLTGTNGKGSELQYKTIQSRAVAAHTCSTWAWLSLSSLYQPGWP